VQQLRIDEFACIAVHITRSIADIEACQQIREMPE
jgi:hypothetical protein